MREKKDDSFGIFTVTNFIQILEYPLEFAS